MQTEISKANDILDEHLPALIPKEGEDGDKYIINRHINRQTYFQVIMGFDEHNKFLGCKPVVVSKNKSFPLEPNAISLCQLRANMQEYLDQMSKTLYGGNQNGST